MESITKLLTPHTHEIPPPIPPKEPVTTVSPTHSTSNGISENVLENLTNGTDSLPPRTSSMSLAGQRRNFSRPGVDRKPLPGADPLPGQHDLHNITTDTSKRPTGIQSEPHYENVRSQASSAATSDTGASTRSSGLQTPDTELADTHTVTIRSSKPVTTPAQALPVAQQTPILHIDASVDDFNPDFSGEPGPIIEEPILEAMPSLGYSSRHESPPYGPALSLGAQRSAESIGRPKSTNTIGSSSNSNSDGHGRRIHNQHLSVGGSPSPSASPMLMPQDHRYPRNSPDHRPASYIDLLQSTYAQQVAPAPNLDNSFLRQNVGANASLLAASKTLEMYRANVKKTNDNAIQYEFAVFMVVTAMELPEDGTGPVNREELIREARHILSKLADRSYPFAQYYLADGYASGLFNKGKEDYDKAFPLFIAAAKRGHAESAYRAALCYEFGWGGRKDYLKAAQYFRIAASKNHPGAATRLGLACINSTMGLSGKYREGVKWLKRAAESADGQYNAAPYELAKLHENGYGDDIFKDEAYAAQLFTQSANLGHPDANLVMGKAYEHGLLGCPQDAGLSIHFYTGAAEAGEPEAMMALCAWYLFGAEPILAKNENEAFAWAVKAAEMSKLTLFFPLPIQTNT